MQTITKNKISDIEEFCKLYKINIPIEQKFEYYISVLKKSPEFAYLDALIKSYLDLEAFVSENNYSSVRSYKSQKLDELVAYIKSTKAYENLLNANIPSLKTTSRDHLNIVEEGQALLSLDFKSANYNVLKTFEEINSNELGSDWVDLCKKFNVHEALVNSKTFRQIIFGKTNPGRLQTLQKQNMSKVRECLQDMFGYTDEDFVFISHDEVIIKVKNAGKVNKIKDSISLLSIAANGMEIRLTPFELKKLKKNTFVKTIYRVGLTGIPNCGVQGFMDTSAQRWYFEVLFSTLHGVSGNKFYMYFKKHILNEPVSEIDLMYYNDEELCLWVDEDAKKDKKGLPHYKKPKFVISIKEASENYSYLWNQMTEILPDMSNEEKRRVVEIVSGACKSCFQNGFECQCWNDE